MQIHGGGGVSDDYYMAWAYAWARTLRLADRSRRGSHGSGRPAWSCANTTRSPNEGFVSGASLPYRRCRVDGAVCDSCRGRLGGGECRYRENDFVTAMKELRPLAERGDANAQYNVGVMYGQGVGVERNDSEAVKWFRKAALQGHAGAQMNLGIIFSRDGDVPRTTPRQQRGTAKPPSRVKSSPNTISV